MQLLCSQSRFPWATFGVIWSALVCLGILVWESIVSARNTAVNRTVPPTKNVRAWDFVNIDLLGGCNPRPLPACSALTRVNVSAETCIGCHDEQPEPGSQGPFTLPNFRTNQISSSVSPSPPAGRRQG